MQSPTLISILLLHIVVSSNCLAQLSADAGSDTAFCNSNWEEASIGGSPTALGGTKPYIYAWSAEYEYGGRTYTASFMLEDTTVANPVFTGPFIDSATFYLSVTDAEQAIAIDTVNVRFSNFIICTGDCYHVIGMGDSAKLGHCISGGIPPYHYSWTPEESLSDPISEAPWAKPISNTDYELVYTDSIGCQALWTCKVIVSPSGFKLDVSGNNNLRVYPNPIIDQSVIEWSNSVQPELLKVYDQTGKIIYSKSIRQAKSSYIDQSVLEKGILVLEIIDYKGKKFRQQIVVL